MRAWALWARGFGAYDPPELIEVFDDRDTAEMVRDLLFGLRRSRTVQNWLWEDDTEFPDLYVRPVEIR